MYYITRWMEDIAEDTQFGSDSLRVLPVFMHLTLRSTLEEKNTWLESCSKSHEGISI